MSPQKTSVEKTQSSICVPLTVKDLPESVIERKISHEAFSVCARQRLFNVRQGTVHAKTRGELLSRSGRKPWKQKGTGRARAGSARSPLWRGGGITFGPRSRVRTLDVPQKVKCGVLNALLYNFISNEKIIIADWTFAGDKPKTKEAIKLLQQANMQNQPIVFFVAPEDILIQASFANIPNVQLVLYDSPNAYDLASGKCWLVLKKDSGSFKEMVEKWI